MARFTDVIALIGLPLLAMVACTGSIMDAGDEPLPLPELLPCEEESCLPDMEPMVLRRLNRREYEHTLSDLFGITAPSVDMPHDSRNLLSFDNDGSALTLAEGDFDAYYESAVAVADALVAHSLETGAPLPLAPCSDETGPELHTCISTELPAFLGRAMRRALSPNTVAQIAMLAAEDDTYVGAVRNVVVATLISPYFLFHYETPDAARVAGEIDSYELADRLSYFLWSSTPDEELMALANSGELRDPATLQAQAQRLLDDARSERFLREFLAQWLGLDRFVAEAREEYRALFSDMREETLRLGVHLLGSGEPIARLVDSGKSFVSAALAAHYGVDFPPGEGDFRLVTMPSERRGLMTHGSVLASLSANPETNPFHRGYGLASRFTCIDPPPAPPDIGALGPAEPDGTIRDIVEQHRANPTCAGCHRLFDHIGLAVEEFDWLGLHREVYPNGAAVDPSGQLHDGTRFEATADLAAALGEGDEFTDCFTGRVLGYALNRPLPDGRHEFMLRRVRAQAAGQAVRLADIITAVITSNEFRGEAQ